MSGNKILKLSLNKRYILALVVIVILLSTAGCGQAVGNSAITSAAASSTTTGTLPVVSTIPGHSITVQDAKKLLDSGSKTTLFVDIRNQTDYDQNHVPGAVLIPANELPSRLSEVPHDKQVIVYAGCV